MSRGPRKLAELTGDIPQNVNFVISAGVTQAFLDAYDVPYETAKSLQQLDAATAVSEQNCLSTESTSRSVSG